MKTITFVLSILGLLLTSSSNAQYTVGTAVNDTIYTGNFQSSGECFLDYYYDVIIEVDAPLLSYVSGLDLKIIITEVNAPAGTVSSDDGELSVGDTLEISDETSYYTFYFTQGGNFHFILLATGVPEVEEEAYPCGLIEILNLPICEVGYIIMADDNVGDCMVEEGEIVGIKDLELEQQFLCFPSPTNSMFTVQNNSQFPIHAITIRDGQGKVLSTFFERSAIPSQIDLSAVPSGLYFVQIQTGELQIIKKVLKI